MKKISYAPKNVLLIAFCVSLFGISVYATTRSGSNAIDSRASGHADWSKVYPWKETVNLSSLPGSGEFQSLSERVQNDQLIRTLFRGGRLYSQSVPLTKGVPSWSNAGAWHETTDLSSLPGNGTIQQLSEYIVQDKTLVRHLFRANKLYVQEVPYVDGVIRWNNASDWRETTDTSSLPGSGDIQSLTERIQGDYLVRTLLRNNHMYSQTVPLENGIPQWSAVYPWKTQTDLSSLPGSGEIQSLSEYIVGNTLARTMIRNARMFTQTVPTEGNSVRWSSASAWREITDLSSLPGSGEIQSLSEYTLGNTLHRSLIRNGSMYYQALPVRNGAIVWTSAREWPQQKDMSTFPGDGTVQGMSEYQIGAQLIRTVIRNGKMYTQTIPIRQ